MHEKYMEPEPNIKQTSTQNHVGSPLPPSIRPSFNKGVGRQKKERWTNIIRYWGSVMLKFNVREGDRKNNVSGQKQLQPHNTVIHTTNITQIFILFKFDIGCHRYVICI